MPSLIGELQASNYRQNIVPFSRFGTRKIVWFKIGHTDLNNGGSLDMEKLNTIVQVIQTKGEIVTIGAPYVSESWGKFMVGIFEDTFNNGNSTRGIAGENFPAGTNNMSETLQQAIEDASGDGSVSVQEFFMAGAPADDHDSVDGWSSDRQFEEYATKAEFIDNSYTQ